MSYESICERNQRLYAELEELTLQLQSSDIDFIIKHRSLLERKESVKALIDRNLELLFDGNLRPAGKLEQRPYYQRVEEFIKAYPLTPVPVIAGICGIKVGTVNNVLKNLNL